MNTRDCIITDTDGFVKYIGENGLQYIKPSGIRFSYPADKLEEGDVIIVVSAGFNQYIHKLKDLGIECLSTGCEGCIVIGENSSDGGTTVQKNEMNFRENQVFLDIVYERKSINIYCNSGVMNINVDGESLICDIRAYPYIISVVNDYGIKFFKYMSQEETFRDTVQQLSEIKAFSGYCDMSICGKKTLREIMPEKVFKCIGEISTSDGYKYCDEEEFFLMKEHLSLEGKDYLVYSVKNESSILTDIIDDNVCYKMLSEKKHCSKYEDMEYNSFCMWSRSKKLETLENLLQKGSATNVTILLTGESGTGKTFMAEKIHNASQRRDKPFIHVNCAAIPYHLLESELFGYEEGAFSGAKKGGKKGLFDLAYEGTIFLDEIPEIPMALQGKLLEVMQSKTYYPVGGIRKHVANVRFIAATNKDLKQMVKEKKFREDLYYRINVFPVEIPPLRDRMDSISSLLSVILPRICDDLGLEPVLVNYSALEKIKSYSWPGNIRELENTLGKAVIMCEHGIIMPEDIMLPDLSENVSTIPKTLRELKEACEKEAIKDALNMFHGDKIKAARYLDIGRSAIFDKIKKYSILDERFDNHDFK